MEKSLSTSNSKRVPIAFISSIVFFAIIQLVMLNVDSFWQICNYYSVPPADDAISFESKIKLALKDKRHEKILITGSSQAREDFG